MSSIVKKQIVAVTGIALVGFVLVHMAGNFTLFLGPNAFNGYSEKLHHLGALLWVARGGLLAAVSVHIVLTISIVLQNRGARAGRYAISGSKTDDTGYARRSMIYTGLLVAVFVVVHLIDFTFPAKEGPNTVIPGIENEGLGLFGLVWNGFLNPVRAVAYIAMMILVGLHLSHGIQSLFQTIGFRHEKYTPLIEKISFGVGAAVAIGFSLVPIYINIVRTPSL
jgi:succinate dehydrogenase / fumarate reductase cytochrome b subunit